MYNNTLHGTQTETQTINIEHCYTHMTSITTWVLLKIRRLIPLWWKAHQKCMNDLNTLLYMSYIYSICICLVSWGDQLYCLVLLAYYSLTPSHHRIRNIYTFASIFLLGFLRDANHTTFLTTKVHLALRHHIIICKKPNMQE